MRLSYVIPCYNMEKYLPKCVDSLYRQSLPHNDFEVIIINDGSKDATLKIAQSYAETYENVVVIDKKNAGVGAARNSGLDAAQGKFLYFIDPDDYLAENVIPEILDLHEKYDLDILTFTSLPVKDDSQPFSANLKTADKVLKVKDGIAYIASRKFQNEIWWYISKTSFIKNSNIRFIEGKWMEDAILTAQLFCTASRIAHFDIDGHRYRILPMSAMRNKTPDHYKKVIYDNANAAHVFHDLLDTVPAAHPDSALCKRRLKTRQQSFVFFLMVRLMKSDISVKKIPEMLDDFETIDAYPLKKFLGEDYHGMGYSFMVFIFNNKILINPFVKVFRFFYNLIT